MPIGVPPATGEDRNRPWIHTAAGAATSAVRPPIAKRRFTKPGGTCRARKTTDSIWSMNVPSPKWARKTAPASRHPKRVDRAIIHDSTAAASTQKRTGARTSFPAGGAGGGPAAPPGWPRAAGTDGTEQAHEHHDPEPLASLHQAAGAAHAESFPPRTGVADEDRARHRRGGQEGAVDAGPQEDDEAEEREDLDEAVER